MHRKYLLLFFTNFIWKNIVLFNFMHFLSITAKYCAVYCQMAVTVLSFRGAVYCQKYWQYSILPIPEYYHLTLHILIYKKNKKLKK